MSAAVDHGQWPVVFREFSRRNQGRPTRLQIEDPELGAQWAELELRFRGAAYEPRYGRVELMLAGAGVADHLTHSVEAVTEVDVQQSADGRDAVLRLGYSGGQTLLYLRPDRA